MRSDQKMGHTTKAERDAVDRVRVGTRKPVWPTAKVEEWHEDATLWYQALKRSGQAQFYEDSDIATAYFLAGQMSDYLHGTRRGAQMFSALLTGMSLLLNTEADRRRNGIELVREDPKPAKTSSRDIYAARMAAKPNAQSVGAADQPAA